MRMLDICAGLGGASQVMRARGWDVVTLDYDPAFECDIWWAELGHPSLIAA